MMSASGHDGYFRRVEERGRILLRFLDLADFIRNQTYYVEKRMDLW